MDGLCPLTKHFLPYYCLLAKAIGRSLVATNSCRYCELARAGYESRGVPWLEEGKEREENSNELISCSKTLLPLCSCF